jgi:putative effector of murein hydrolase LrgA (UPF0299 family)
VDVSQVQKFSIRLCRRSCLLATKTHGIFRITKSLSSYKESIGAIAHYTCKIWMYVGILFIPAKVGCMLASCSYLQKLDVCWHPVHTCKSWMYVGILFIPAKVGCMLASCLHLQKLDICWHPVYTCKSWIHVGSCLSRIYIKHNRPLGRRSCTEMV